MLKEALSYLVSLKENKTYFIHGDTYSDKELFRVAPYVNRPFLVTVNGLDSIVKLVRHELNTVGRNLPVFIRVDSPRFVEVIGALDSTMGRDHPYKAECDAPKFNCGWRDHDTAIIELRSMFIPNEGTEYLLDLLSRMSKEDGVTTDDNGISQTVTTRQGISLKNFEAVRGRIALRPFRTFAEVEQPESEFILRLDDAGRVGLLEADGGYWKMEAKQNICRFFEKELAEEISGGSVVVMM